jgi:hypothetical protein
VTQNLKLLFYFETGEVFKTFQKIIFKQNNLLRFSYYIFWGSLRLRLSQDDWRKGWALLAGLDIGGPNDTVILENLPAFKG